MRNTFSGTRASFLQILRRTRTRRAEKHVQKCTRSAGKRAILEKKIARGCAACVASLPSMARNVCAENRACFLQILRRTRAHFAQNKSKNTRVRLACTTKLVRFSAEKLREVVSHVQCRRRRSCMALLAMNRAVAVNCADNSQFTQIPQGICLT